MVTKEGGPDLHTVKLERGLHDVVLSNHTVRPLTWTLIRFKTEIKPHVLFTQSQ